MPFPQLIGQTTHGAARTSGRAVFTTVLVLAAILAVVAWRLLPRETTAAPQRAVVAAQPTQPRPEPPTPPPTEHQQLHLAHAEQELVAAAEQLNTARRLLAALSPELSRSYLQLEKRRADSAWTACDTAQRAIEHAREDIKAVSFTRKDN